MDDYIGRICSLHKSDSLPPPITVYEVDRPSFFNYEFRSKVHIFAGHSADETDVLWSINYSYIFWHQTMSKKKIYWRGYILLYIAWAPEALKAKPERYLSH